MLDSIPIFSSLVRKEITNRRDDILNKIVPHLKKNSKILDVGSGTGHTANWLIENGYIVTCVDLNDLNIFENTKPIIYDGKNLPFKDHVFDTALIITVLHHTPDPEAVIKEVARVSESIVVMEDTYNNWLQKRLTMWMDSVSNLEFIGHPHTNKTDKQWQELFNKCGLVVEAKKTSRFYLIFESTTYYLVKKKSRPLD